jgi:hypothetical protein
MHLGIPTGLFCSLRFALLIRLTASLVDCFILQLVVNPLAIVGTVFVKDFWIIVLIVLVDKHLLMHMMLLGSLLVSEIHSYKFIQNICIGMVLLSNVE